MPNLNTRSNSRFALIILCFALSGLSALIYQLVWTRYLATVLGTSEIAIVTVLAAFMAGLGLGAIAAPLILKKFSSPISTYIWIEIFIAAYALAFPILLGFINTAHTAMLGGLSELPPNGGTSATTFYAIAGTTLVIIPTVLMGATLPILVKAAVTSETDIGRRTGLLYTANTFGAVVGTLISGFWLIPSIGLFATSTCAAGINLLIALIAWTTLKGHPTSSTHLDALSNHPSQRSLALWLVPILMLLSGFVAFGLEVTWTRLIGHILGSGIRAFSTMLATFLIGIALGGLMGSFLARTRTTSLIFLSLAQILSGLGTVWALANFSSLPDFITNPNQVHELRSSLFGTVMLCGLFMLPTTIALGMTFPLAIRAFTTTPEATSKNSGTIYAWNTLGAIGGALLFGWIILPEHGFAGATRTALCLTGILAAMALIPLAWIPSNQKNQHRSSIFTRGISITLLLATCATIPFFFYKPGPPTDTLRQSPFYGRAVSEARSNSLFQAVGRSSTVSLATAHGRFVLRTNGLPEASIAPSRALPSSNNENPWMALLPTVSRPHATSFLSIGFGGGSTLEFVPPSIKEIDAIELEPEVIAANRTLEGKRARDPLADPRLKIHINDARSALQRTTKTWDIIVSQPSHPFTGGASHLYTKEFFQIARQHLTDDGIFLQWIGREFAAPDILASLLATIDSEFGHTRLHLVANNYIILAAPKPILTEQRLLEACNGNKPGNIFKLTNWRGILYLEDILATLILDEAGVKAWSQNAPMITDNHNRIAAIHPFSRANKKSQGKSLAPFDPIIDAKNPFWDQLRESISPFYMMNKLEDVTPGRLPGFLHSLKPNEKDFAILGTGFRKQNFPQAKATLASCLRKNPSDKRPPLYRAFLALIDLKFHASRRELFLEYPPGQAPRVPIQERDFLQMADKLNDFEKDILRAFFFAQTNQWNQARTLSDKVSPGIQPNQPVWGLIQTIRATSRIRARYENQSDLTRAGHEAAAIIDAMILSGRTSLDIYYLRAQAALIARDTDAIFATYWSANTYIVWLRNQNLNEEQMDRIIGIDSHRGLIKILAALVTDNSRKRPDGTRLYLNKEIESFIHDLAREGVVEESFINL